MYQPPKINQTVSYVNLDVFLRERVKGTFYFVVTKSKSAFSPTTSYKKLHLYVNVACKMSWDIIRDMCHCRLHKGFQKIFGNSIKIKLDLNYILQLYICWNFRYQINILPYSFKKRDTSYP